MDSYTTALLHMNGADASTVFVDESGKTWAVYGDAQIDTAQSKFGGSSGLFDGVGDYIDTPDSADFNFGTLDFTVDFWARPNGAPPTNRGMVGTVKAALLSGWYIHTGDLDGSKVRVVWFNTVKILTATGQLVNGVWSHVALVRYGNTVTLYVNGVSKGTDDCTGDNINSDGVGCFIGALTNAQPTAGGFFPGWLEEVRISKGIARWTANFTPPTLEYRPRRPGPRWWS